MTVLGCNPATERGSKFNDRFGFNISGELPVRMPVPEFLSELLKSLYKEWQREILFWEESEGISSTHIIIVPELH